MCHGFVGKHLFLSPAMFFSCFLLLLLYFDPFFLFLFHFRCASLYEVVSVRLSVRPSVCPSICLSVRPSVRLSRVIFEGKKSLFLS